MENIPKAASFEKISCESFPIYSEDEIKKNFSHDQITFYHLCHAVVTGIFPSRLVGQKLGPLCHSRWLTLGQRILALYILSDLTAIWDSRYLDCVVSRCLD